MSVDKSAKPSKLRWGELDEDDGEDLDFLLPPKQVIGPDDNGIKKVIEYKFNDDGNKIKITTTTRVRKLAKARLSKRAVERRNWPKFGDAVHEDVGSRLTMVSTEEILLERPRAPVLGGQPIIDKLPSELFSLIMNANSIDYIPEYNDFSTFVYILLKFCKTVLLGLFMEDNAALKLLIFPDSARVYLLLKAVGLELSAMHQWIYCCPDSSPREYVLLEMVEFGEFSCTKAEDTKIAGDNLAQLGKGGAVLMVCRTCGKKGDHWTSRCPYKDLAQPTETFIDKPAATETAMAASGATKGAYVPPSMRAGAERTSGSDMRRRNEENSVRVTNLSEDTREPDLLELFRTFGPVSRVYVAIDQKTGVSRGFGFVNFVSKEDAERAINKLNGYGYDNLILRVEWATPRTN
ncbi:hypothetical protein POTOM_031146 [Populus tomentosa]|uniref:Eukaryotic translation initiation factor 3 subunit G n=1 Tax=Populus tomentosa TaxID=118781 RepID=A0A8X7Z7U2_POPTO|nr:hypothetical protein POTOM_031146 [Populus tomentosa]